MLSRLPWAAALALAMVLPLGAADDKKKDAGDKSDKAESSLKDQKEAPKSHAKDHVLVGSVGGTIKDIGGDQLTLTVKYPDTQANQATLAKGMQQAMRSAQRSGRTRSYGRGRGGYNPVSQMIRMQQMVMRFEMGEMRAMQNLARNFKWKTQDLNLTLSTEVKVRVKEPPTEFDDKGNLKRYTSAELKVLKGDSKAWGYPGDPSQLKPGQFIAVYVYKKKKPAATTRSLAKKDEEATVLEEDADGDNAVVRTIYIMAEGQAPATTANKGKKR